MARPREFDQNQVMSQIMNLFWQKGFKSTSMEDLIKVTGLNKGSLYLAFGNKEKIFKSALESYSSCGPFEMQDDKPVIDSLCAFYKMIIAEAAHPPHRRRGCFVFNSCLEFGNKSDRLTPFVVSMVNKREEFFVRFIKEAQRRKEISRKLDPKKAAQRIFATAFTLRGMAQFRPDKEFLHEVANAALASLGLTKKIEET